MAAAALLLALLATTAAGGDVYFEQKTVTTAPGAAAGPGVVSRVWYSGKKMRMEAGGASGGPAFVLRLDTGQAFRLDPQARTATALDVDRLRAQAQMDMAMAGDLMGAEEGAARTTALRAGKTIAGYPCRGFRIRSAATVMDVYVTDALPVSIEAFTDFLEWSGASQSLAGVMAELRRLPGFPLQTRSRVSIMGEEHETVSTVTLVKVGPLAPALFERPKDYRLRADPPPSQPSEVPMGIIIRILVNAVGLYATTFVPGITWRGSLVQLVVAGAILGLFNLIVKPLAMLISLPLLIVTLGLFYFILNGILLWLAQFILPGYAVSGLVAGILGALVMTVVNWVIHALIGR